MSDHWVYVMREGGTGALKIGKCSKRENIETRLKELQTGCPYEISVIAVFPPGEHPGEGTLHKQLAEYRIRPSGEWFVGIEAVYRHLGILRLCQRFDPEHAFNSYFSARINEIAALAESALHLHDEAKLRCQSLQQEEKAKQLKFEREVESAHKWIARELARHPDDRFSPRWLEHDFLQSNDFIIELVKAAMWQRWSGKDLRRFLLVEASFGIIETNCYGSYESLKDRLLGMFEWCREHDPELLTEAMEALNGASPQRGQRQDVAA